MSADNVRRERYDEGYVVVCDEFKDLSRFVDICVMIRTDRLSGSEKYLDIDTPETYHINLCLNIAQILSETSSHEKAEHVTLFSVGKWLNENRPAILNHLDKELETLGDKD